MIVFALLKRVPASVWAGLLAVALIVGGLWVYGRGERAAGRAEVQSRWDAAELARQQAETDQRREDIRIANAASREFEAWRADLDRRRNEVADGLRKALQRPISCPAVAADVLVPADAVGVLRAAAADRATGPAASEPGR